MSLLEKGLPIAIVLHILGFDRMNPLANMTPRSRWHALYAVIALVALDSTAYLGDGRTARRNVGYWNQLGKGFFDSSLILTDDYRE